MQIMLAPVKLYSELIIKVSFSFMPLSHTLNTAVWGGGIPQVGQHQNKEGCSMERKTEKVWDMPGVKPYAQC